MVPIKHLRRGSTYLLDSRNLRAGVWTGKAFIGAGLSCGELVRALSEFHVEDTRVQERYRTATPLLVLDDTFVRNLANVRHNDKPQIKVCGTCKYWHRPAGRLFGACHDPARHAGKKHTGQCDGCQHWEMKDGPC